MSCSLSPPEVAITHPPGPLLPNSTHLCTYSHTHTHTHTHTQLLPILMDYLDTTLPSLCLSGLLILVAVFVLDTCTATVWCIPFWNCFVWSCWLLWNISAIKYKSYINLDPDLVFPQCSLSVPWQLLSFYFYIFSFLFLFHLIFLFW